ncbi:MAG: DUF2490 domain-containing protein [Flavobacteriales bacterium]|nr:DUF2490 domain-containing protein [Flavobacteriales bacterium]
MNIRNFLSFVMLILVCNPLFSQETTEDNWDNELWAGTRFSWGENKFKYSGEFQTRFNENYTQLENWYVEGAVHYLTSKHFEFVADARNSVSPTGSSFRAGAAVIAKFKLGKFVVINQFKGQADNILKTDNSYALREVLYLNYPINEKWMPYVGGGVFFRKSDTFNGLQVIRAGAGVYYNYNPLHSLSINYFVGQRNTGNGITYSGIFLIQLTLKFSDDYIYMPARFINF